MQQLSKMDLINAPVDKLQILIDLSYELVATTSSDKATKAVTLFV